jgi:4'-phosphopantetheinyl transferase
MTLNARTSTTGLPPATIDVWTFALDIPEDAAAELGALLSAEERDRASRFRKPQDALRYQVAHARLREILAGYVSVSPASLAFATGTHGKPYLSAPETALCFNLAHSDALAAVAVVHAIDIGIDIERIKPLEGTELEDALSPREQNALAALSGTARREAFYRCWTRKEALLKAHGRGLDVPLDSFDVPVEGDSDVLVRFGGAPTETARDWRIVSFAPAPGYAAALAFAAEPPGLGAPLRWRTWPETR